MSSEFLASGENVLDSNLGGAWDIINGYAGRKQDLGIARRFGGAAAAYSLRDIGAMNGRVVKVRRDSDDEEEDFSANQVSSGALEDWVNGKLESTLPADVATAAAAYSLRKVKASYSGNAVQVRRTSDDAEVNVAFDSDSKVSSSSSISTVSGSTTATSLGGFLTEDVELFNQDFSTGTTGFNNLTAGNNTASRITTDGFTSNTSLELNLTNDSLTLNTVRTNKYMLNTSGATYTIKFYAKAVSGSANLNIRIGTEVSSGTSFSYSDNGGEWKLYTYQFVHNFGGGAGDRNQRVTFFPSADITTVWRIDNFEIIQNTQDATVHTWYDQAGSNDAVQETAANQPQIAEGGALLTKRGQTTLKFRGTDSAPKFLEASASITASHSVFIVGQPSPDGATDLDGNDVKNNTFWSGGNIGTALHIAGINNAFSEGYRNSGDASRLFSYTATQAFHTSVNLHTAINGSSNFSYYANTVSKISDLNGTLTDTAITIGKKTGIDSHNTRGFISEFIQYNSDQSDNRFKIESNINNYYGLYNDANEVTGAFTSSGAEDFTANGTDGFTLTNSTSTAFGGIELNQVLAAGEKIYVSFNLSIDAGANTSPNLNIREGSIIGSTASDEGFFEPSEGFNSTVFTSDSGGDARYISFGENDADPSTYTISDFKISRIARNGLVETWYDQSGNGNDATQENAGQQPAIVQNGGITTSNGSPSVRFDGSDDELDFTDLTLTDATVFNVINFDTSKSSGIVLGGSAAAGSGGAMIPFMINSSSTTVYVNSSVGSQFVNGASTTFGTRLEARTALRTGSQLLYTIVDLDVAEADTIDGIGRTPSDQSSHRPLAHYNEVIIYNSDLSSDRGTIESEIANHYNITLS